MALHAPGRRARLALVVATLAAVSCASPPRASAEGISGALSQLNYGLEGGLMAPNGPQGHSLKRAGYFGVTANEETSLGFVLGLDAAYTRSRDPLRTGIGMLSVYGRLSPTPEDFRAYIQVAAGAYRVSYNPPPSVPMPASRIRPGASIGFGFDPIEIGKLRFGAAVGYHGILLATSSALSYVTATLDVTLAPTLY